ncbi:unnamed protein product, partial [Protopolystoma xenopodis]
MDCKNRNRNSRFRAQKPEGLAASSAMEQSELGFQIFDSKAIAAYSLQLQQQQQVHRQPQNAFIQQLQPPNPSHYSPPYHGISQVADSDIATGSSTVLTAIEVDSKQFRKELDILPHEKKSDHAFDGPRAKNSEPFTHDQHKPQNPLEKDVSERVSFIEVTEQEQGDKPSPLLIRRVPVSVEINALERDSCATTSDSCPI